MAWLIDLFDRLGRETWRNPLAFASVWVPTLTVLILSLNPALTSTMAALPRFAFWTLHVAVMLPLLLFAQRLVDRWLALRGVHPIVQIAAGALLAAVLFAPGSMALDLLFAAAPDLGATASPARLMLDEVVSLAIPTLSVWLLVNSARLQMLSLPLMVPEAPQSAAPRSGAAAASAEPPEDPTTVSAAPRAVASAFWSRIPPGLGADLVSLSAEQHYLHVTTTKGRSLILFPISRAVEAVAQIEGLHIHRSHWVALRHVVTVEREKESVHVVLSSGERLPVSRSNRRKLQETFDRAGEVELHRQGSRVRPLTRLT